MGFIVEIMVYLVLGFIMVELVKVANNILK